MRSHPVTDPQYSGEIETSPTRARGWAIGDPFRLSPLGVDAAVAFGVFGASVVNVAAQDEISISELPAAGFVLLALSSIALFWRRNWSPTVLGVVLLMTLTWTALGYPGNPVFHILVALYAVGRYFPDGRISLMGLALALGVVGFGQISDGDPVTDAVTALVLTTLPWYVGRRIRIRRDSAREHAEQQEWKRAAEAQRVIAEARAGIARELHDVVAHNVSLMTVQAGVARLVVADDPGQAREAIGVVEDAGRRALDELRHLLGVLRPETASGELAPQPSLNQVQDLVDQLRQTGVQVSLVAHVPSDLGVRLDLFAYRIVQESLTNVLKHGGVGAVARVHMEERDGHLTIEVTDNGTTTNTLPGSGQGIVGMRERALLLGGTLEAGPLPGGGFRVFARLPIGER